MKVRECRNILNQESHNPEGLRRSVEQIYCYSRVIHGGSGGAGLLLVKFDVCRRVVVLFGPPVVRRRLPKDVHRCLYRMFWNKLAAAACQGEEHLTVAVRCVLYQHSGVINDS
jgi:hypothetical protein